MAWFELIPIEKCRVNGGTFVEAGGNEYAVFRLADPERVIVIDNACPHASGNLSGGGVDGAVVTCPWHQWRFDLDRGECVHSPLAKLRKHPCDVRDGVVYVEPGGSSCSESERETRRNRHSGL